MSKTALIVIDMINPYDFPDAEKIVPSAEKAVPVIAELLEQAPDNDWLTIYVNDNWGDWHSNRDKLIEEALDAEHGHLVDALKPSEDALFVIKARHSIFYQTPLEYLLAQEGVDRLVLTGQVTEQCVLYSALDAYIRHHEVRVPPDAVACIYEDLADAALKMMERNMSADLTPARG